MDNKSQLILEAYQRSERMLQAQLTMALAADARALTFSGLLLAAASILGGMASGGGSVSLVAGAGALPLVIAAGLAGFSARPVDFYIPGGKYEQIQHDIDTNRGQMDLLSDLAQKNDKSIRHNSKLLRSNGRFMLAAFWVAVVGGPIAALIGWWLSLCFRA